MAKPVMPSPSIPIVTGSPMTRPWVEFLRSLASQFDAVPVYANNAAAITGGLAVGGIYRLGADPDHLCIVH